MGAAASNTNTYTKADIDKNFYKKPEVYKKQEVYNKQESDSKFQLKGVEASSSINTSNFYSKLDIDGKFTAVNTKIDSMSSPDPSVVVPSLINNQSFLNNISTKIAASATELGKNVASNLPEATRNELKNAVLTSDQFKKDMGTVLTTNPGFQSALKGDTGSIASDAALKASIQPKTIWCAEGELCDIPTGKKGIKWGYGGSRIHDDNELTIESDNIIRFKTGNNVTMAEISNVNSDKSGLNVNVLRGLPTGTGRLHLYSDEKLYLLPKSETIIGKEWGGSGNLSVQGELKLGSWVIKDEGEFLTFKKGDGAKYFMHDKPAGQTNDKWVGWSNR